MSHIVISPDPEGGAAYHEVESLDAAVAYVEQLRNTLGVSTARICRLEELKFDFQPVYKVMLDDAAEESEHQAVDAAGEGENAEEGGQPERELSGELEPPTVEPGALPTRSRSRDEIVSRRGLFGR